VHEAFERKPPTSDIGEWAALARPKMMVSVELGIHAWVVWRRQGSADTGKAGIGVGIDIEVARRIPSIPIDINIRRVVIRRACHSIILPRSTGFSRTPLLAGAQRDQITADLYLADDGGSKKTRAMRARSSKAYLTGAGEG
jgi:hypothetical protein